MPCLTVFFTLQKNLRGGRSSHIQNKKNQCICTDFFVSTRRDKNSSRSTLTNSSKCLQYRKHRTRSGCTMVPTANDHLCTEHTYWTTDGKHWICSCSHCHIGRSWFNRSENEVCQGNGCTVTRPVPPEIFRSAEVVPIHIKFSQNWHCPSCGKINQPACFYCARCRIHHPLRKPPPRRWQCPLATCRRINTMQRTDIDAAMHHMCRCGFVAY